MTPLERIEAIRITSMLDFACWVQEKGYLYFKNKDCWKKWIDSEEIKFTHEEVLEEYLKETKQV